MISTPIKRNHRHGKLIEQNIINSLTEYVYNIGYLIYTQLAVIHCHVWEYDQCIPQCWQLLGVLNMGYVQESPFHSKIQLLKFEPLSHLERYTLIYQLCQHWSPFVLNHLLEVRQHSTMPSVVNFQEKSLRIILEVFFENPMSFYLPINAAIINNMIWN